VAWCRSSQENRVIRRPRVYQRSTKGDNAKETVTRFVDGDHAMELMT
jgi:hypothetical protein